MTCQELVPPQHLPNPRCLTTGSAFPDFTGGAKTLCAKSSAQEFIGDLPFEFRSSLLLFLPFLFPGWAGVRLWAGVFT